MDPTQAFEQLLRWLGDISYIGYAAPLCVLLTALIKRIPYDFVQETPAAYIHFAAQVVFWVIYSILQANGQGDALQRIVEVILQIGKVLLPGFISLGAGVGTYAIMRRANIPIIGYQRPSIFDEPHKEGADPRLTGRGGR